MKSTNPFLRWGVPLIVSILIATTSIHAQIIRCGTMENDSMLRANNPNMESVLQFESWLQSAMQDGSNDRIINGVYTIPVVFHVIHNGEAVGTGSNISQAVLQSQIDVLNEDYRRILGSNGYNTNAVGADCQIEFCLAQRRPDGSAFTAGQPGVNRINRSTAGFSAPPYSQAYMDATVKTWTYNGGTPTATRGWDPGKYLNIWIADLSGGLLGYAQFPQSPIGGIGCGTPNLATDGVVFLYSSIGKSSVSGFPGPYNEGRTATHEIGHWLGLRHIWGDVNNCATTTDWCDDTPAALQANFGCPSLNSCTNAPDTGPDMVANYMDYTDDLCMNVFTLDQKMRMRTVLTSTPLRMSLISSDACIPPNPSDASVVNIINPTGDNCAGAITPQVVIKNRGSGNLTSATINYTVDNGSVTTFSYTGSLTPGSTATVSLPAFTTTLGIHTFTAYSTLPNGVADPSPLYDTTAISFAVSSGYMGPYTQDFESQNFPPDIRWSVVNSTNDCYTWTGESATSSTGVYINNAAMLASYDNGGSGGVDDYLYTPIFLLPCSATVANFTFDVAYQKRVNGSSDRLRVEISTDCGTTWSATAVYDKQGTTLASVTGNNANPFFPTAASNWRNETVNLLSFVGGTSKSIRLRFRATNAGGSNGNNIWVDNYNYNTTTPGEIKVTQGLTEILDGGAYSFGTTNVGTPVSITFTVYNTGTTNLVLTPPINITGTGFTVATSFGVTTVPAGSSTTFTITFNPATSGFFNQTLSFTTNDCDESTFNFQLTGTGTGSTGTASFTGAPTTVCIGQTVTFTDMSTGASSWSWNFGAGASPATATTAGPHSVTYSTAGSKTVSLTINGTTTNTQSNYITVNAPPTTANAGPDQAICRTSGSATMAGNTAATGAGTWTQVSGPVTGTITTASSPTTTITGMTTAGTYVFQWTIANAPCTASSDQVQITVNASPTTANAGPDQTVCAATATLAGNTVTTGAGTWTFISGPVTPGITTPSSPTSGITGMTTNGNYVFQWTITNAPCTASSDQITITRNTSPTTANAGPDQTICRTSGSATMAGNTATVGTGSWTQISGPVTGTITTASSPTTTITGMTTAGTYVYQWNITNAPCTPSTDQVQVTVNAPPTAANAGPDQTVCASTATLAGNTATTGAGTWTFISGPATPGITTPSSPTSGITGMTLNGNYIFQWTITNAPCTASSDQITITRNTSPTTANAGPDQTICTTSGSATMAGNTATVGTGSWTQISGPVTGTITTASSPTTTITGMTTAGTYVYQWNITNVPCTPSTDQVQVTVNAPPTTANAGPDQTVCAATATLAGNTVTSGAGTWTFISGPATPGITTPSSPTSGITGMTLNGNYIFQWTTTNTPCTASSDQVTITRNTSPTTANAGPDQTICGSLGSATMAGNTATVGTGSWTQISGPVTGSITTPSSPSTTITGLTTTGTYVFQWNITNAPCAASTDQVQVTVSSQPMVSITGTTSICVGMNTTLTASGSTTYSWNTGPTTAAITVSPTTSTTYSVIGSVPGGCADTAYQLVTVNPLPNVGISGNPSVCLGSSTVLTGSGANSYVWNFGPTTSTVIVSPSVATTYTVTGTDGNNCVNTATHTVTVNSIPAVSAGSDALICPGNSTTLTASGGVSYTWNNGIGSGNPVTVSPSSTTTYIVQGMDVNNCSDLDTVVVNVSILPSVSFNINPDSICTNGGLVSLSGTPGGGSFSGTGVSGSNFDPSAAGTGTFALTYTVMNADNCPATANADITVIGCSGIEGNDGVYIDIYPNPSDAFVNIVSSETMQKIELFDMHGKLIMVNANQAQNLVLSLNELASGLYHFRIHTAKGVVVKRVIRK